jgi:predicted Rossmann fold flavoprotein
MEQDVVVIGAGAAGLMCAIQAGRRGRSVLVIEQSNKPGRKILMSGGGRCNFTNYDITTHKYISQTEHFCKSAFSRYTQWDFIAWVNQHQIPFHEKTLGQLFCDRQSKDILEMLLKGCQEAQVEIQLETRVQKIEALEPKGSGFMLHTSKGSVKTQSLVIATGGLSIPSMGSSPFAYEVAQQFGLKVLPTSAGLVPFVLSGADKAKYVQLSGISAEAIVSHDTISFRENILWTHKGLSGPAILQISSYWKPGTSIHIRLLPDLDLFDYLKTAQKQHAKTKLKTLMGQLLPKRVVEVFLPTEHGEKNIADISHAHLSLIANLFQAWEVIPSGTEGYKTAEVTLGGVCCSGLSSKTMEAKAVPGLYFIGEAVDVTGWLGGYNFQWAWSSGWAAGHAC